MPARSATPIDVESDEAKAEYWWRRCQEAFAAAARAKADELTVKRLAREEAERAEEEQRQKEAARIAAVKLLKEAQRVAARVAQRPPSGELMWGRAVWPLWACLSECGSGTAHTLWAKPRLKARCTHTTAETASTHRPYATPPAAVDERKKKQ